MSKKYIRLPRTETTDILYNRDVRRCSEMAQETYFANYQLLLETYLCMVTTYSSVWINRIRLTILLMVS